MTTFNAHGVSTTPLALTDDHGTWLLLEAPDAGAAEGMIRTVSVALGCSAVLCSYPMTGRQAKDCTVHGTLSVARDVGRAIHSGSRSTDPVNALIDHLRGTPYYAQCRLLFSKAAWWTSRREVGRRLLHRPPAPRAHSKTATARDGDRLPERVPAGPRRAHACAPSSRTSCVSSNAKPRNPSRRTPCATASASKSSGVSAPPVMRSPESSCPSLARRRSALEEPFVPLESLADP